MLLNVHKEHLFTVVKHNCLLHVERGWFKRKKSDDVELCSHLWFPTPPVWSPKASAPQQTWECNSSVSGSPAIFKTHFISLARSSPSFFFSVFLSFWFDEGKSWGEVVGSVQQLLFFFWHRGGRKGNGPVCGRRQRRAVHLFVIDKLLYCLCIVLEWLKYWVLTQL